MEQKEIIKLAQSLRRIDQSLLAKNHYNETQRIWYQGGEPYFDLFIELYQGDIQWFQFTLRGQSLSWQKQGDRWQTGNTNELHLDDFSHYPASKTIEKDCYTNMEFFELAQAILRTSDGEDPLFRKLLERFNAHSHNISQSFS